MKKLYQKPECQVSLFEEENLITASGKSATEVAEEEMKKDSTYTKVYVLN